MAKSNHLTQEGSRNRGLLIVCIVLVILLGLASRQMPFLFPKVLGKYPGDVLWSLMVFLGCAYLKPTASTSRLAIYTLIISYGVELSQLIQVPWIVSLRHTTLGHLILGTTFSWLDIVSYTMGISIGALGDYLWTRGGFNPGD